MSIFLTSDTHFNNDNIIKYCNRPFFNHKDMNEALIANWNSVVKPEDTVYHLGDFIIADAKDVDLAGGITTMGQRRDVSGKIVGNRTRPEFQDQIRELIKQDVLDIMLASTSTIETLAR